MLDDEKIISLYLSRDELAIAHTAQKYGTYCGSIAFRILGNREDAEESVNDTYLRAWNAIPPAKPAHLSVFLGRITRNLALDRYKEATRKKRGGREYEKALDELEPYLSGGVDPEELVLRAELRDIIKGFLKTLPEQQRRIFVLRYWHLYTSQEIASQYGCSDTKVRSMLHRTRHKLQDYLIEREVVVNETGRVHARDGGHPQPLGH